MRLTYILFFLAFGFSSFCQEQLTGLQFNPVIKDKMEDLKSLKSNADLNDTIPVSVPFFDDFSKYSVFPSPVRWIDQYGFQNADWPINPVNLGALTLDAINDSGSMYPDAVAGPETFIADHLTSRYIRLDSTFTPVPRALNPSDSVYLSFYYQPEGRGSAPKSFDSLVLQFLVEPAHDSISPDDSTFYIPDQWRHIWATRGMPLDTFFLKYNSYFKQVMIPVTDTSFFKRTFRFQFYNYVSLASNSQPSWQSNCCQWNIDNVYLNKGRTAQDTIYSEIRFIERPPSMLTNYQSMPYTQYSDDPTNEMIDTIAVTFRNRDSISHMVSYKYEVTFPNGTMIKTYKPDDVLVRPYYKYNDLTLYPPVTFLYPISSTDSAEFVMKHFVKDITPGSMLGDTITALQKFYNYYAYDDGTPENGYGLTKTGSMMAYRFKLNKSPDTLRGVSMYFNKTLTNNNQQFFYLTVWNDNNGKPGDTIYSRLEFVRYADNLNQFITYRFEVPVRISGDFYIGTITTTDDNLNIGFDSYNDAHGNLLYNSTGQWLTSAFTGSLLMRPLIGKPIPLGIPLHHSEPQRLSIYPNPCSGGMITVTNEYLARKDFNADHSMLVVRDLYGREVISARYDKVLDVSGLPAGMYILEVINNDTGNRFTGKLVITR
jgi:hypothetical protein